jgi:putative FmdB family regulatory protein
MAAMPVYEYYCRRCATTFEKLRPMRAAEETATCPAGHPGAARTLSLFATLTRGANSEMEMLGSGSGCACGGACSCGGGATLN